MGSGIDNEFSKPEGMNHELGFTKYTFEEIKTANSIMNEVREYASKLMDELTTCNDFEYVSLDFDNNLACIVTRDSDRDTYSYEIPLGVFLATKEKRSEYRRLENEKQLADEKVRKEKEEANKKKRIEEEERQTYERLKKKYEQDTLGGRKEQG